MILKIYSVYDSKTEFFSQPLYMKAKGEAVRSFTELANDKSNAIGKYPADYTLFELGTFDDATGKFVLHSTPTSIGLALEFVKQVDEFCQVSGAKLSKVN